MVIYWTLKLQLMCSSTPLDGNGDGNGDALAMLVNDDSNAGCAKEEPYIFSYYVISEIVPSVLLLYILRELPKCVCLSYHLLTISTPLCAHLSSLILMSIIASRPRVSDSSQCSPTPTRIRVPHPHRHCRALWHSDSNAQAQQHSELHAGGVAVRYADTIESIDTGDERAISACVVRHYSIATTMTATAA